MVRWVFSLRAARGAFPKRCAARGAALSMACSRLALLVLLMISAAPAVAPNSLPTLFAAQRRLGAEGGEQSSTPQQSPSLAAVAMATAAAAAAGSVMRRVGTPDRCWSASGGAAAAKAGPSAASPIRFSTLDSNDEDSGSDEDFEADCSGSDGCDFGSDEEDLPPDSPQKARAASRKLWSKQQFPEGTAGVSNYEMANLTAAQEWVCPCPDRSNCISAERVPLLKLYDHRKDFRTKAAGRGGLRDANRKEMQQHYDEETRNFTRSFVVGAVGDCCAASAGLANGLSYCTWADSRADVRKARVWHAGRAAASSQQQSMERAHLEAYIREVRAGIEGPKGGSTSTDHWHISKATAGQRWTDYVKKRSQAKLPVIGSKSLFEKIWRAHKEIIEDRPTGHSKCDRCGELDAREAPYVGRSDAAAVAIKKEVLEERVKHAAEHRGERDYAEDFWMKGEHQPQSVTALSMDAPTETQFDVPVQQRTASDPVKALDNAKKWSSKITGLMIAGCNMLAFVTRDGLGSGPNLSLTVLYLGLLHVVASMGSVAPVLNILLDNTTGCGPCALTQHALCLTSTLTALGLPRQVITSTMK